MSDRGNDRIQEFTATGAYVRSITATGFTSPLGLTFGPRKTLYASRNFAGAKLFRWDWDDTAPVLSHDYDGEWHSQPFTVTFSAKDDYTDVPWLRWTLNMVDWTNTRLDRRARQRDHARLRRLLQGDDRRRRLGLELGLQDAAASRSTRAPRSAPRAACPAAGPASRCRCTSPRPTWARACTAPSTTWTARASQSSATRAWSSSTRPARTRCSTSRRTTAPTRPTRRAPRRCRC